MQRISAHCLSCDLHLARQMAVIHTYTICYRNQKYSFLYTSAIRKETSTEILRQLLQLSLISILKKYTSFHVLHLLGAEEQQQVIEERCGFGSCITTFLFSPPFSSFVREEEKFYLTDRPQTQQPHIQSHY